ncbi:hypothetical protein EWZ68_00675 [Helicobacter pylori]|uniref:hypothetical protein n=1 Tax=Helicobacter pylori TaxID=210 RepID=UPI0013F4469A|nr:hypothetical protein [Helicobacter pylori]
MIKSFVATAIESSITAIIEPLEKGGSFNQRDREKFMQATRTLGIEDSVINSCKPLERLGLKIALLKK